MNRCTPSGTAGDVMQALRICSILVAISACDGASSPQPEVLAAGPVAATPVSSAASAEPATPAKTVSAGDHATRASGEGITITAHTVIHPPRTGSEKEDYWVQYQVYGEITNDTNQTFESVSGRITFHDAKGAVIGIQSIGTAIKEDFGDESPGETIFGAVHFVAPGQSVPFHFTRNLAAIKGEIASHQLHARRGTPATNPPKGVAVDVKETFEGDGFARKRVFTGTIRNDGEGPCRSPAFVVAFLDDAGKIASIESWDASDDLRKTIAQGESIAFHGGAYVTAEQAWRERAAVKSWVDCDPVW